MRVEDNQAFLGIDPGKQGAFVLINEAQQILWSMKVPLTPKVDKLKQHIDIPVLIAELKKAALIYGALPHAYVIEVFIEKAGARANQRGTLTTGVGYGILLCAVHSIFGSVHIHEVTPQMWKKDLGLSMKDDGKEGSITLAHSLFPGSETLTSRPRSGHDDNIAEALLVAEWGRRLTASLSSSLVEV